MASIHLNPVLDGIPEVDAAALAAQIRSDATRRVASMLLVAFSARFEAGHPIDELSKRELIQGAIEEFDGFERATADTIVRRLADQHVRSWGSDQVGELYQNALNALPPEPVDG